MKNSDIIKDNRYLVYFVLIEEIFVADSNNNYNSKFIIMSKEKRYG